MTTGKTMIGAVEVHTEARTAKGSCVDVNGERFYRIENVDAMPPFLMSVVSDSDHWIFASSTGALTAGRRDPDRAVFPYTTDDHIHDSREITGGKTIVRVQKKDAAHLWEPFSERHAGLYKTTRSLAKNIYGNKLLFEEVNHDLGLRFAAMWMPSECYGLVRRCRFENLLPQAVEVELLDGVQNLLPAGLTRRFQMEYSTLADGYKESELEESSGVGLFKLSSIPADRAEPSESLRATTVWSEGLQGATHLLSVEQLDRFRHGQGVKAETLMRGRRGAYLLVTSLVLDPRAQKEWSVVIEAEQDVAAVVALRRRLALNHDQRALLDEDVKRGSENLRRMVASADGLQLTGDELHTGRHFANVLFNIMRGGIPANGNTVERSDFSLFLKKANQAAYARSEDFLAALPEKFTHAELLAKARTANDADLERLAHEYLPLTFSRRHGDPSRPWNIFAIDVKGAHGERILNYQGNWRDIFQNWEALSISYADFVESMIFKFVNASTADGHNPYRVMREGFEWETLDPHDAWSFIGYWGDHQVVYLLKLLEVSRRFHPRALEELLGRRIFIFAHVPYRIKPYAELLRDPRSTIVFDAEMEKQLMQRVAEMGADGKALLAADGALQRATLVEKLLIVALARLFNFIPEAGIWMNTQRPEWNDANNALVGYGVSVVTLCALRRYMEFLRTLFAEAQIRQYAVSVDLAEALLATEKTLRDGLALLGRKMSDRERKHMLDALGRAGEAYRAKIYTQGFNASTGELYTEILDRFCVAALAHIDHAIRRNRRADGLYHSYNLMKVEGDGIAIRNLYEMLEGQVAVLGSGVLSAEESIALLGALRSSQLYREDQQSYLLYPDRRLPGFFAKNAFSYEQAAESELLRAMIAAGDRRIVVQDAEDVCHFHADFRNADLLDEALCGIAMDDAERKKILALYEQVFDHQSFTGRSGTFYKYEGLGCIYWHMVAKLALETQGALERAIAAGESVERIAVLRAFRQEIREGIGAHKRPAEYGAIPTDPYSHTPSFAGVQQPGMTGQVKEDVLARMGAMGVQIEDGCIRFNASLVVHDEFLAQAGIFHGVDVNGKAYALEVPAGAMAFTLCQTPVIAHNSGAQRVEVLQAAGERIVIGGLKLSAEQSAKIYARDSSIRQLEVFFGLI